MGASFTHSLALFFRYLTTYFRDLPTSPREKRLILSDTWIGRHSEPHTTVGPSEDTHGSERIPAVHTPQLRGAGAVPPGICVCAVFPLHGCAGATSPGSQWGLGRCFQCFTLLTQVVCIPILYTCGRTWVGLFFRDVIVFLHQCQELVQPIPHTTCKN